LDEATLNKLRETFESFDSHHDETINEEELGQAMKAMGYPDMTPEQLKAKMAGMDRDGSGDIDLDEFCILVSGCHLNGKMATPPGSPVSSPKSSPKLHGASPSLAKSQQDLRAALAKKNYGATSALSPLDGKGDFSVLEMSK